MKGVVLLGDRKLEIRDYADPTPGPGEVLIAMKASGICGSDLVHHYRRPHSELTGDPDNQPIAGHEPAGVVAALGPGVKEPKVGTRVIVHHYDGCGRCAACRIGFTQACHIRSIRGLTADGSHADYMTIGALQCVEMPEGLSFVEGAALACGTGTGYSAFRKLDVSGRHVVAVFGQGAVGLSATMFAAAAGAGVIAVEVVPQRREMAKKFGARWTIDPTDVDPVEAIKELTHGEGADAAIECTGINKVRIQTVECLRMFGKASFVGGGRDEGFEISHQMINKELTLRGSWAMTTVVLAELAQYVVDRQLPVREIVTHTFPLSKAVEAFRLFDSDKTGKVMFVWD